jgi:2-polyprenyl-6-hydroxyphenyl methylase/3-demethylubiquinone-9 3-methyltransferase
MITENLLDQKSHFAFGRNWLDYADKIDEEKISHAMEDLRRLSGQQRLDGKSFLDIGCGSGVHSLAALRLGASSVQGVDIDPDSVAAARTTLARFAPGVHCDFRVCSVFDMTPNEFGSFDIVYSWGVLHHTGDMVRAVTAAAALVKRGGEFHLALYRKTPFCGMWKSIKRWYSRAPASTQNRAMDVYVALVRMIHLAKGSDFKAFVQAYGKRRGMNFFNDVHDWLGGYPYESISADECRALLSELGLKVEREFIEESGRFTHGLMGSGCDEYAFRRS